MGLGQVRDLRRSSVRSLMAERHRQQFASVRDLFMRVPLQRKEVMHLIQCGALDDLGSSRAAALVEAGEILQAGSALQLTFDLGRPETSAEGAAQRLAWEKQLLGQPVSVHPLDLVRDRLAECLPLRQLAEQLGQRVTTAGVRLPGWTGGPGFYLGDGDTFITARHGRSHKAPPAWQPVLVRGRCLGDEWGDVWLQIEEMVMVDQH